MKPKTIKGKELLKQISAASFREDGSGGYHNYEIEDILKFLAICISDNANLGYSTSIAGLGTFKVKQGYSIKGKSNLTGEEYNTLTDKTLSFRVDSIMKNMLNKGQLMIVNKRQLEHIVSSIVEQRLGAKENDLQSHIDFTYEVIARLEDIHFKNHHTFFVQLPLVE